MFIMFINLKQASPTATNVLNRWLSCIRQRSLRSPMMMVEPSSKRANIWGICTACLCSPSSRTYFYLAVKIRRFRSLRSLHQRLWMFALFEDVFYLSVKPQVPFASLSPPAVMDVRPLRGRFFILLLIRRFRSLRSLHQRLWMFAAVGDACLRWMSIICL